VSERPILFSDAMVRAILEGRKTQTRRVMASGPPDGMTEKDIRVEVFNPSYEDRHGDLQPGPDTFGAYDIHGEWGVKCPYGQPGDLLWVREAWRVAPHVGTLHVEYRSPSGAAPAPRGCDTRVDRWCGCGCTHPFGLPAGERLRWRPSIHMPRWASRLTLRVAEVRVERLQAITEEDAIAEGITMTGDALGDPVGAYAALWDSINRKRPGCSWTDTPWVWVVSFTPQPPTPAQGGGEHG
jgi:hypothetical protein